MAHTHSYAHTPLNVAFSQFGYFYAKANLWATQYGRAIEEPEFISIIIIMIRMAIKFPIYQLLAVFQTLCFAVTEITSFNHYHNCIPNIQIA